ncbi:putative pentatricopeptide repeat-containing protein [Dichanthelium oligosanthes]|uniref:Putative pentatricopeptide repeat-containing protein n=1 Tax=Dichanthelium oligosanthes TaxID=888268 RepID=A0A1E5W7Q5_9POAL|nr:putative pentatricopeptide repeat-containing protein [Dichanthelium oligosanthes]
MPPPRLGFAILATACNSKPIALLRRLVLGSCPPAVRHNASQGPPPVGLPPCFRQGVLPRGHVLGSLRFCHASASECSSEVYASEILRILKSISGSDNIDLGDALCHFVENMDEDVVLKVLQKQRSNWQVALAFFNWVAGLPGYAHGSRAYTEMLDILGRMKKVRLMRQLFDEIPEEWHGVVVTNKMFAVLLNRYAGAHKVQEAIEVFYLRKDYGFELDLVGFQILLMSLCRYKHVEEAEALFRQKKDEFPHVIKSWNIILNGWCVKGSMRDAQRIWNDIIASKVERDLFTYGTFINTLTKDGRIGHAVKLFNSMWEKGINPDVAICNCIIDQLCFKKRIPEALEIFGEMNDRHCQADVATYNTLIKYLCKIKRMEKVYELLDEMEAKGCSPNNRTYSYILKTTEKPKDVIALVQRMEESVQEPAGFRVLQWLLDLWNGWATQFLVVFSLTLQVGLLFFAGVRRHKNGGLRIGTLWLAYQLADSTATYALGTLSLSSALRGHQLVALWAPFLLLHLGGPDNITAYSLEDNKLWKRHLLTLFVQVLGAGYILYKHISSSGTFFGLGAAFMTAVGVVKFWERTWALKRACLSIIRDSVRTETPVKGTFFLEYEPPRFKGDTAQEEEFFKQHAHTLFHICKSAMVDSSVDDQDPGPARLLEGFTEHGKSYRWKLMEMELSLMYDILYTKAAVVHTLHGYCIRVASSLAVATSLLLFRFSNKAGYSRVDVAITYILLAGALLLETTSLLSALFSTWTFAFLCTTRWSCLRHTMLCSGRWEQLRRVVVSLHRLAYATGIAVCLRLSRRWHGTMGQYSMLDKCTRWHTGSPPLSGLWAWTMLGPSSAWSVNVPGKVKDSVLDHISSIVRRKAINTLGVIRLNWGVKALKDHKFNVKEARLGAEIQEAIVIWHIATDILLAKLVKLIRTKQQDLAEPDVEAIKAISQYMMFLLVKRPAMLPGLAQIKLYQRTEQTLADQWKLAAEPPASWIDSVCTMVMELRCGGPNSDSRLQRREKLAMWLFDNKPKSNERGISSRVRFGVELATKLYKREEVKKDSLQIVLAVWIDILVYTANRCSRESHAKQLSGGGEFTTLIWLMTEHRNESDYYKADQYR